MMHFRESMKLSFGHVGRMKCLRPSAWVCGKKPISIGIVTELETINNKER
ncbi:hypothetical protein ACFL9T_22825 [Thermodesulfobacteriota bacterium]